MYTLVLTIIILVLIVMVFLEQPKFGKKSSGIRLAKISASPNFKNGAFQNQSPTPQLTEGATIFSVLKKFFFEKTERRTPTNPIPSVKTNLLTLDKTEDV